jgi:hypothetical protein
MAKRGPKIGSHQKTHVRSYKNGSKKILGKGFAKKKK